MEQFCLEPTWFIYQECTVLQGLAVQPLGGIIIGNGEESGDKYFWYCADVSKAVRHIGLSEVNQKILRIGI